MGLRGAVAAQVHNDELTRKSAELEKAIGDRDWVAVERVMLWMRSRPFDEY